MSRLIQSTVTLMSLSEALDGEVIVSREMQGSGFVIDVAGRRAVATAYHVVEGATEVVVMHPSGMRTRATALLAVDRKADVAVLEVEALPRHAVPLALGDVPPMGYEVALVSSPLGLDQTLSFGTVAAHRKSERAFQVSAGVSPGSSGGLVCDRNGRAVGVIRAKASTQKGKRKPLPQPPNLSAMVNVGKRSARAEASDFFTSHPASAHFSLKSASSLREHVCVDSGQKQRTVALAEIVPNGVEPTWRIGNGKACATFRGETEFVVAVGAAHSGEDVAITIERQRQR